MNAVLKRYPVHLLCAHEVGQAHGMTSVAVCGELVATSCPPECECDHRYCPDCVRAAIRWSAIPPTADWLSVERAAPDAQLPAASRFPTNPAR
jgi:hypothetical protein